MIEESVGTKPQETQTTTPQPERVSVSLSLSHVVALCGAGLLLCFFMPWINLLFVKPTGLDFAKQGEMSALLWSLPIFAALTLIAGLVKSKVRVVGIVTSFIPFIILGYALSHEGKDTFEVMTAWSWIGLALGFILFVVACRSK